MMLRESFVFIVRVICVLSSFNEQPVYEDYATYQPYVLVEDGKSRKILKTYIDCPPRGFVNEREINRLHT